MIKIIKDILFGLLFATLGYIVYAWLSWDLLWFYPAYTCQDHGCDGSVFGRISYLGVYIILPNLLRHKIITKYL